jgi:uncharacterized protein YdeI (YjbR/CyaY-like superfamily)
VAIPPDLQAALAVDPEAAAAYTRLSYSHRREYVRWIEEAKRAETRANRIARALEMIKRGEVVGG